MNDDTVPPDETARSDEQLPTVRPLGPPEAVPVFNCVLFIKSATQQVTARVANMPDIAYTEPTEREAIMKVVTEFKRRVAASHARGEQPPWLNAPWPSEPDEQQRLIAVHL